MGEEECNGADDDCDGETDEGLDRPEGGVCASGLAGRCALRAPERTTEEVLEDPRTGSALAAEQRDALGEFLEHCDRVKFALHEPAAEERERQLDSAEGLVRKTSAEDADEPDGGGEGA